jgi:hypothetical protein
MFFSADMTVARCLPHSLVSPAFSTSSHERTAVSNNSHTLRAVPEMTSGSLLSVRLRN